MTTDPAGIVAALDAGAMRLETPCGSGRMVWRAWGDGPPLVLLHGGSGSWTHWVLNVPALASRFRVIAADMPGYGDSDLPPDPQTAGTLADVVSAGIDRLVPPPARFDLAGFSFGGIIGGLVAARQGARVRTLVLIGAGGMALPRAQTAALLRIPPGAAEDEAREAHRENLRRLMIGDPERADDLAVHVHAENVRRARFKSGSIPESDTLLAALPEVRARIAGLWGDRDVFAAPFVDARREILARFAPDLDFRVIAGAGHWLIYEAADRVNATLLEMLGPGRAGGPDRRGAVR